MTCLHKISNKCTSAHLANHYRQYEPIEITIEPDGISVLNCPGPDRSISREAIEKGDMLRSRRYRNRRLGDFLKELELTEGRSTGVPTIQLKLEENGSPRATFETTDDRLTFLIHIPVRKFDAKESNMRTSSGISSGKTSISSGMRAERSGILSQRQLEILGLIEQDAAITAPIIAMSLGISTRSAEKQLRTLREAGFIRRTGSPTKGGKWEIIKSDKT